MRIGILADTHIPGASQSLPQEVKDIFADVDIILHAGDIYAPSVLDELQVLAPVFAAKGDDDYVLDHDKRVKEMHNLVFDGIRVHLVHKMPIALYHALMRGESREGELEGAPDILVVGHTHCDMIRNFEGVLMMNPGSPTFPKQPSALGTIGILAVLPKMIDAQEAYRVGLVNRVVPLDKLMPAAKELAEAICEAGPLAVRTAKEAMIRGMSMSLEEGLRLETTLTPPVVFSRDFEEGIEAFAEKRKPEFEGR